MSSSDSDIDALRATVDKLSLENARLRQQLSDAAAGRVAVSERSGGPLASQATTEVTGDGARRRRRWLGKTVGAVLLVLGFALGVLVSSREGSLMNRAFREGYEDGAAAARMRREEPTVSPAPLAPPAAETPRAPASPAP